MLASKVLRAAERISLPGTIRHNPYKARKPWPPDFTKLDTKYQFRLERRYRRRMKLKWERPRWIRGVKLAQWVICLAIFGYGVLALDLGDNHNPFSGVREWVGAQLSSIWTEHPTQPSRPALDGAASQPASDRSAGPP